MGRGLGAEPVLLVPATALLLLTLLLVPAAAVPLEWSERRGSPERLAVLDRIAIELARMERESGQPVMLLLAGADLGSDGRAVRVIFVRLEHPLTCGSAGCATTAYRIAPGNQLIPVWSATVQEVAVAASASHGMRDLLVNGTVRLTWDGQGYRGTRP